MAGPAATTSTPRGAARGRRAGSSSAGPGRTCSERDGCSPAPRRCVFPVRYPEPFGLVHVEAMACGTPVAATRLGAVPEIVEDGSERAARRLAGGAWPRGPAGVALDRRRVRERAVERFGGSGWPPSRVGVPARGVDAVTGARCGGRLSGVLAVFAHPDDESLLAGGALAACAAAGRDVTIVSLTRGELGPIAGDACRVSGSARCARGSCGRRPPSSAPARRAASTTRTGSWPRGGRGARRSRAHRRAPPKLVIELRPRRPLLARRSPGDSPVRAGRGARRGTGPLALRGHWPAGHMTELVAAARERGHRDRPLGARAGGVRVARPTAIDGGRRRRVVERQAARAALSSRASSRRRATCSPSCPTTSRPSSSARSSSGGPGRRRRRVGAARRMSAPRVVVLGMAGQRALRRRGLADAALPRGPAAARLRGRLRGGHRRLALRPGGTPSPTTPRLHDALHGALIERCGRAAGGRSAASRPAGRVRLPAALCRRPARRGSLVNLSGATVLREEHMGVPVRVYLETDPVLPQIEVAEGASSRSRCSPPTRTTSPTARTSARPAAASRRAFRLPPHPPARGARLVGATRAGAADGPFTTVANWRQSGKDVEWGGETYTWSKDTSSCGARPAARSGAEFELALVVGDPEDRGDAGGARLGRGGRRALSRAIDPTAATCARPRASSRSPRIRTCGCAAAGSATARRVIWPPGGRW